MTTAFEKSTDWTNLLVKNDGLEKSFTISISVKYGAATRIINELQRDSN